MRRSSRIPRKHFPTREITLHGGEKGERRGEADGNNYEEEQRRDEIEDEARGRRRRGADEETGNTLNGSRCTRPHLLHPATEQLACLRTLVGEGGKERGREK